MPERNCHQDALNDEEFERLVDVTGDLDEPYDAECRLILFLGGRLGMRAGEITHLRESWINWRKQFIEIPTFDRCDLGQDGEQCGYCKKSARQTVKRDNNGLEYKEALADQWSPKTSHSLSPRFSRCSAGPTSRRRRSTSGSQEAPR